MKNRYAAEYIAVAVVFAAAILPVSLAGGHSPPLHSPGPYAFPSQQVSLPIRSTNYCCYSIPFSAVICCELYTDTILNPCMWILPNLTSPGLNCINLVNSFMYISDIQVWDGKNAPFYVMMHLSLLRGNSNFVENETFISLVYWLEKAC